MPDFPIVDTHIHLWDPSVLRYPWLDDVPFLNKPYLLEDYRNACGTVDVGTMIFVQCAPPSRRKSQRGRVGYIVVERRFKNPGDCGRGIT